MTCLVAWHDEAEVINNTVSSWHEHELVGIRAKDNIHQKSTLQRDDLEDSTGLLSKLVLWIGARVMVTSNISLA